MTETDFSGDVAIVTGAGVGIGASIAGELVRRGAKVLLNDVNEGLAIETADTIREATGGACAGVGGDVSDVATVRGLVDEAVRRFGGLTIAICNAGLTLWGDFFSYGPEDFDRVTGVNLRGSFFLAQAAARQMRVQGGGRILLMSSVTGHQAIRYIAAYAMTKAALEMMAKNLVLELSPHNITINCVAPGATVTPRNLNDDPDYAANWAKVTPMNAPMQPIDIAEAALFLVSKQARYITGQTIVVDGGWTAYSPTPDLNFVERE